MSEQSNICPQCNYENLVGEDFCQECGFDFGKAVDHEEFDARLEEAVADVLEPREPPVLPADATVGDAVKLLNEVGHGCIVVVEDDVLVGIFSERDLVSKQTTDQGVDLNTPLREAMTPDPVVLKGSHSIAYALNEMALGGFRHLPLVDDDDKPVGILSTRDILNKLYEYESESAGH